MRPVQRSTPNDASLSPSSACAVRVAASPDGARFALLPPTGGALLFDGGGGAAPVVVDTRGARVLAAAVSAAGAFAGVADDGALFVVTR